MNTQTRGSRALASHAARRDRSVRNVLTRWSTAAILILATGCGAQPSSDGSGQDQQALALLTCFLDAWNRHDVNALMSMMTDDCVYEEPSGKRFEGQQAVREAFLDVFEGCPDARWDEARHFVHGNVGVSQWTFRGTVPTSQRVEVKGCDFLTLRDGKIALIATLPIKSERCRAVNLRKHTLRTDIDKEAWISDLETFIPQLMERAHVPGLSIAVIKDAEIIWTGSFGVKSNQTKEAGNDTTVFQAASLSKTTFAFAVMKLVERGELELDTPLSDYMPGPYIENDDRVKLITARRVLSHTTGFPNWRPKGGALRLYFTPGEKFSYSGEGYVYLQRVVEHITAQPLDRFMQEQVFEPLGMRHSSYEWRDEYESNYAVGHTKFATATDRGPMRQANAAASLYTTAGDYARFLVAMMRGTGLQEKSIGEMLRPQVHLESCLDCTRSKLPPSKLSEVNAWGLGWGLQTTEEGTSFWHWGDQDIFRCYTVAFKDQKLGLVYFTNSKNGLAIRNELVYRTIGGDHPAFSWLHYDSYQFLDFSKVDTTVDAGVYDDYVGQYAYAIVTVTREGNRVFAQRTMQPKFEIFPKLETAFTQGLLQPEKFFWKVVDAQVEFVKDDQGKVTHALHSQGGMELAAPKIEDTNVDSDIVGQYAYEILNVTREGDRLFAQRTRQPKFEIFPKSETEFFWKVVDAQVEFVKDGEGKVTHAFHDQGGIAFTAPKIRDPP